MTTAKGVLQELDALRAILAKPIVFTEGSPIHAPLLGDGDERIGTYGRTSGSAEVRLGCRRPAQHLRIDAKPCPSVTSLVLAANAPELPDPRRRACVAA
jgi:hypothetical protein